jgi:hypothetical protein
MALWFGRDKLPAHGVLGLRDHRLHRHPDLPVSIIRIACPAYSHPLERELPEAMAGVQDTERALRAMAQFYNTVASTRWYEASKSE